MATGNGISLVIMWFGVPVFLVVAGIANLIIRPGISIALYFFTTVLALPAVLSVTANLLAGPNGTMETAIFAILSIPLSLASAVCSIIASTKETARVPKSEIIAALVAMVAVALAS